MKQSVWEVWTKVAAWILRGEMSPGISYKCCRNVLLVGNDVIGLYEKASDRKCLG
jgi:hypothetical protein